MLHIETVEPNTFSILDRLMRIEALKAFSLVGGTALSLRYGHRTSIDLDFFYHKKFDHDNIITALKAEFGNNYSTESKHVRWGIFCYLDDVKVDIVYYPHLPIQKVDVIENIRMYSDEDIIAMKLNAILGRGKKKDFWDLYELLHHYTLENMIRFHEAKFPEQNLSITIPQAITYFDEAEESEDPVSLKGQTWETIKKYIQRQVRDFLK